MLASLVPLTLLGLALLGELGLEDVWRNTLAPEVEQRVTGPVFAGIDHSVERIFGTSSAWLILLASLLLLWHLSRGVRIVMKALNVIHDVHERRSRPRLIATDLALTVALGICLVAAALVVIVLPRLGDGLIEVVLTIAAWAAGALLLGVAIALLVRYAPAERPEARWASAGSALVVVTWLLMSLLFGWWALSIANYKTAAGTLLAFLFLTAYVLASSAIFLAGAQLDELARRESRKSNR